MIDVEQKKVLNIFLWDCTFSQLAWKHLNEILEERNLGLDKIISYEKIFDYGGAACATLIKLKIINEMKDLNTY